MMYLTTADSDQFGCIQENSAWFSGENKLKLEFQLYIFYLQRLQFHFLRHERRAIRFIATIAPHTKDVVPPLKGE